jgi:hypothetical protein
MAKIRPEIGRIVIALVIELSNRSCEAVIVPGEAGEDVARALGSPGPGDVDS